MTKHTLLLAVSASAGTDPRRWLEPVLTHWPRPKAVPTIETQSVDQLIADGSGASGRGGCVAALVVLGPDYALVDAYKLVDSLQQSFIPAVVLFPELDDRHTRLQGSGVLIESWEIEPHSLAATLYALAERQPAVEELRRELRIAASYQGGVRGEIDRIHEELNLAALVQQEFLPKEMPAAPGLDFGILFRPAGYVSGDIYDLVRLDEAHVGFFIADAVGHGVPAALLTMVISRSLRMTEPGPTGPRLMRPADAMTKLNQELIQSQRGTPRFATAVYGIINTQDRRVTLSGAGHPPPLRIRRGSVEQVETDGPLLGVFADEAYTQTSFVLGADETLLLYSDGFETAFPEAITDTEQLRRPTSNYVGHLTRLALHERDGDTGLAGRLAELASSLDRQTGSLHQIDDVTALAIGPRAEAGAVETLENRAA